MEKEHSNELAGLTPAAETMNELLFIVDQDDDPFQLPGFLGQMECDHLP